MFEQVLFGKPYSRSMFIYLVQSLSNQVLYSTHTKFNPHKKAKNLLFFIRNGKK